MKSYTNVHRGKTGQVTKRILEDELNHISLHSKESRFMKGIIGMSFINEYYITEIYTIQLLRQPYNGEVVLGKSL